MRLTILWLVTLIVLILSITHLITNAINLEDIGGFCKPFIFVFLLLYYCVRKRLKFSLFGVFLLFYTLGEMPFFFKGYKSFVFYYSTICFIIAYWCMFIFIVSQMRLKDLFVKFYIQIIILFILGAYVFYSLERIMAMHFEYGISLTVFILDLIYNLSFILLLIFSLLNYLQKDSKKNLVLFLCSACIVFSELMQVVYFFADQNKVLQNVYSAVLILGFCFAYLFINLKGNKYIIE